MRSRLAVLLPVIGLMLTAAGALAAGGGLAAAGGLAATGDGAQPPRRVEVGGDVSVAVAPGWHVVRQRWSQVIEPIPRLAMADFRVHLDLAHPCACDWPSVTNLPPAGAFVFIWEYPLVRASGHNAYPGRPSHFRLPAGVTPAGAQHCVPSYGTLFRIGRQGFQVEAYLGPRAGTVVRARIAALLDSLRASATAPARVIAPVSGAAPRG